MTPDFWHPTRHHHIPEDLDHQPAVAGDLGLHPGERASQQPVAVFKITLSGGSDWLADLTHQHGDQLALGAGLRRGGRIGPIHAEPPRDRPKQDAIDRRIPVPDLDMVMAG
jgi:hypothetical protein